MRFVCLPPFPLSNAQAAHINLELACELHGKCAYVEAIKLYEEARDTSVQQHLTVAVLNTVIAAVAAPLLLLCCTAKCHSKACRTRLLPHATVPYAQGVQGSRGAAGEENAKILVLHPMTAVAPVIKVFLSPHPPPPIFVFGTWRRDPPGRGQCVLKYRNCLLEQG